MAVAIVKSQPFPQELELIFREYGLVYRTVYGVTGSVQDAEDITQTIFLHVLRCDIPVHAMKNPAGYLSALR
jgi:DNA-directed RNA polymerase specialized sigma24 family protein